MSKQVIVVRKDLNMRKGKIASQVAHAAGAFVFKQVRDNKVIASGLNKETNEYRYFIGISVNQVEYDWVKAIYTKIVAAAKDERELTDLIAAGRMAGLQVHEIIDSGLTEFHGVKTLTCACFGPDEDEKIDAVTGHLPLL
jgi:PTH2 family peptidyl-tRNA hydrolase